MRLFRDRRRRRPAVGAAAAGAAVDAAMRIAEPWPLAEQASADLREKVACLARPETYPERPAAVRIVQTHMSFVFLTGTHAYKLKKPVRYAFLDFRALEARRRNALEELRLNRRLAPGVYLEVVPLTRAPDGALRLGAQGAAADWLVKMRELARERMLDAQLRAGTVREEELRRAIAVLADFYRRAAPVRIGALDYRLRFERAIRADHHELCDPRYGLPRELLQAAAGAALGFLGRHARWLDRRAGAGRIREGHGDLRPEHVCLGPEPLFIDCLEFSRELRVLDPADEIAYLALECERAGAARVGEIALEAYRSASGDDPPLPLLEFYQLCRALLRAKLSVWHLKDPIDAPARERWLGRGRAYLDLALARAARLS